MKKMSKVFFSPMEHICMLGRKAGWKLGKSDRLDYVTIWKSNLTGACVSSLYMGVSKNSGTPKWMVKIMENPIKMDDLGVPLFSETSTYANYKYVVELGGDSWQAIWKSMYVVGPVKFIWCIHPLIPTSQGKAPEEVLRKAANKRYSSWDKLYHGKTKSCI